MYCTYGVTLLFLFWQERSNIINRWSPLQLCTHSAVYQHMQVAAGTAACHTWRCSGSLFWLFWFRTRILRWLCLSGFQIWLLYQTLGHGQKSRCFQRYVLEMSCTVVPVRRRQGRCQNDGVYWRLNSPPLYKDCYWGVSSEFLLWWSQTCFQNIPLCIISTGLTCCNGVNICPFVFFTPNFNSCFFPQQAFLSLLVVFHSLMQGCQTQFGSGATYRSGDHCNHNILTYK